MGTYDGGQSPVDSSTWKRPVSNTAMHGQPKEAYTRGAIARAESTGTGIQTYQETPDPYENGGNGHTLRNFGHGGGQ